MTHAPAWVFAGFVAYLAGTSDVGRNWGKGGSGFWPFSKGYLLLATIAIAILAYWSQILAQKIIRSRIRREKRFRLAVSKSAFRERDKAVKMVVSHVPRWFGRRGTAENAEWINEIVRKLWPSMVPQLDKMLCASLNPILEVNLPPAFTELSFESFRFGLKETPRFSEIRAPTGLGDAVVVRNLRDKENGDKCGDPSEQHRSSRRGKNVRKFKESRVALDLRVTFSVNQKDDASVRLTVKTLLMAVPVFLDNISIDGKLRLELRNVGSDLPCFRAIAASFLEHPRINFDLIPGTGFDVAHLPFLHGAISSLLRDRLREAMVSPSVLRMSLVELFPGLSI